MKRTVAARKKPPAPEKPLTPNQLARRRKNKWRILLAAAETFDRIGYANAAVADIVKTAGTSSRAFYEHFASREDVLMAVVELGGRALSKELEKILEGKTDPMERLELLLSTYIRRASEFPMIGYQVMAAGEGPRNVRKRVMDRLGDFIAAEIVTAHRQGKLSRTADPVMIKLVMGGIDSLLLAYHADKRRDRIPETIPVIMEFVLRAFR